MVHARDGLLPDVAALREAHRALDDAGLAGQVVGAHVDAVARDPALDPQRPRPPRRRSRWAPASSSALRRAPARLRGGQQVDAGVGGDDPDGQIAHARIDPVVFRRTGSRLRPRGPRPRPTRGPRSDRIARSAVRSAISTWRPILYMRRCRSAASSACGSVSSHSSSGPADEDPHVGEDVRLGVQQRGVAALAGRRRLDVVRDLALEELCGVRAASRPACRAPSGPAGPLPR